jgi:hypothetical protein
MPLQIHGFSDWQAANSCVGSLLFASVDSVPAHAAGLWRDGLGRKSLLAFLGPLPD